MRYNQIINEANYKNKFDFDNPLSSKAEFEAAAREMGSTVFRPSKPQAGGAIYYIDDKIGILGFMKVIDGVPTYYMAKEPFIPAKKGVKTTPNKTVDPLTFTAIRPRNAPTGYTGMAYVTLSRPASYDELLKLLLTKPGMDPNIAIGTHDGYKATAFVYSKIMGERQLRDSLHGIQTAEPAKATPKSKSTQPKDTPKSTPQDALLDIKTMMKSAMAQGGGMRSMSYGYLGGSYTGEYRDIEEHDGRWLLDVRHWGAWSVPPDVSDEDAEDYDWEVLNRDWRVKMNKIVADVSTKYPDIVIDWSTEEKNYISVWASSKK